MARIIGQCFHTNVGVLGGGGGEGGGELGDIQLPAESSVYLLVIGCKSSKKNCSGL